MEKILYPNHPVRCLITGPSLHQDLFQKLIKCFSNYIPIHIIPKILNEEDIDVVIEKLVKNKDFEQSDTDLKLMNQLTN